MLFDTHAHYDAQQFDPDREATLAGLPERGVSLVVNPGCDIPSSEAAVELAGRFPFLYAAVGFHPENCADYEPAQLEAIQALAKKPKVVAIGEIGLDYYWEENPPREHQQRVFRDQLALAEELDLPVIVHDRVPLLLRQRGDGKRAGQAGMDALLHRRIDLPERPQGGGGRRRCPHRAADDRDRQPIYGPSPPPGGAQ